MSILIKPVITEKWTKISDKQPRYTFIVRNDANKFVIRQAVESHYDVKVESVNTLISRGKAKSRMTKAGIVSGKRANVKKAIVTLQKGQTIDFFNNI